MTLAVELEYTLCGIPTEEELPFSPDLLQLHTANLLVLGRFASCDRVCEARGRWRRC